MPSSSNTSGLGDPASDSFCVQASFSSSSRIVTPGVCEDVQHNVLKRSFARVNSGSPRCDDERSCEGHKRGARDPDVAPDNLGAHASGSFDLENTITYRGLPCGCHSSQCNESGTQVRIDA